MNSLAKERATPVRSGTGRVMIVDDDQDYAQLLADALEARGYETRTALEALDATLLAAKYNPELVIIDVGLPGMDGHELMAWLRSHPEFKQRTVFIAITGNPDKGLARRSIEAGFRAHLLKPIDLDQVLEFFAAARNDATRAQPAREGAR